MNLTKIKKYKNVLVICFVAVIICILLTLFISKSFSELLDNDVEVEPNSTLTYYLDVSYDGVDKNGVASSDTQVSEIKSGYLYVQDKLPDGLTFDSFVTTSDGSIGAVTRSDESICTGKVVDDTNEESLTEGTWNEDKTEYTYHGLHYNAETRTVSFTVKNLKAGCKLTVGINTITPETVDDPDTDVVETRRDFYNFATAREKTLTVNSNTVHTFMGSEKVSLYTVSYKYKGDVPDSAPIAPSETTYAEGASVGVASDVEVQGYEFSGWSSSDVEISDGSFTMPGNDVVLYGSFTKKEESSYKVKYKIDGTTPESYVLPSEKTYVVGESVNLDSLKVGTVFNGYRFLGWTTSDVEISEDDDFIMPENDVVIVGKFEEVTYQVIYQFYDTVQPENPEKYLPETKTYKPGDTVTLEDVLDEPDGYKFLGWYKESTFTMPEKDVTVYGEWKLLTGTFEPTITKEIVNERNYYKLGDTVEFKITVNNTASFALSDVIVKEDNENAYFIEGDGYSILSDHVANIDSIAANSSMSIYATYVVQSTDKGTITNTAEIKGALAGNNYELADKDYIASTTFKIQSQLKICKKLSNTGIDGKVFQFHVTGTKNNYETWVTLETDKCETVYLVPSTYKISEVIPQEYEIKSVEGAITSNNASLVIEEGKNYTVTYTNEFKKKYFLHSAGRVVNKVLQGGE